MLSELGFTVLRQIPTEFLPGILSGAYSLHGGVLRDAAGRIVAHLLTAGPADLVKALVPGVDLLSGLVGNGQIFALSRSVEQLQSSVATVLQVSAAGTALSGIGLVTNVAGAIYLARRLDGVQRQIGDLDKKLDDVKRAVVTYHFATLKGAMDNLRHAEQDDDAERKRGMLLDAKRDFQAARHYYSDRLRDASTSNEFAVLEECLSLAMTGSALTASELHMYDVATADFQEQVEGWREVARQFVQRQLLAGRVEKLLELPPKLLPVDELVRLLDFAEGTEKGWSRIDDLRALAQEQEERQDLIPSPWSRKPQVSISVDGVRTSMVLRQRALLLDAQVEHLRFLAAKRITARTFAREAKNELSRSGSEALFVVPSVRHAAA